MKSTTATIAVAIIMDNNMDSSMVPPAGIEPTIARYKRAVIPFNYKGLVPPEGVEPPIHAYKACVIPFN